jgi:hypothetical protein
MPALAHLGIGLAAKRIDSEMPLWALLLSSMFLDILSMTIFLISPLWTNHGLFMAVIWSVIATLIVMIITKRDFRKSIFIGLLVFSHWVLDFIGWPMTFGGLAPDVTGVPIFFDMTLTIGLGVYSTIAGALIMDLGTFIVGFIIYIRTAKNIN